MNNEPVAWMWKQEINGLASETVFFTEKPFNDNAIPLYTHPVKELTDEEIDTTILFLTDNNYVNIKKEDLRVFAKAILRKAQEK